MAFELPKLPYAYDALEPYIDARTMEIHHGKHHAGYTAKLNAAIEGTDLADSCIENLLANHTSNNAIRNNGGGYFNHNLFWNSMSPNGGGKPSGDLGAAIDRDFGSYDAFVDEFSLKQQLLDLVLVGLGFAFVKEESYALAQQQNQDNPLMPSEGCGCPPIMGLDVWEHAYYLNYQNRRPDYIEAFFSVINWNEVQKRYDTATKN